MVPDDRRNVGDVAAFLLSPMAVPEDLPQLCKVIPKCPMCGGQMELVYDRPRVQVCVCVDCHTSITVPMNAWDVAVARGKVPPEK